MHSLKCDHVCMGNNVLKCSLLCAKEQRRPFCEKTSGLHVYQAEISDRLVHVNQGYMVHLAEWSEGACPCVRVSILWSVYCSGVT